MARYGPPPTPERIADAVCVAGSLAAAARRPRAVVLVVDPATVDGSRFTAGTARRYLARLGVPLLVWTAAADPGSLGERWGEVASIATWDQVAAAVGRLRARLDSQAVVWLPGRHPLAEISVAGGSGLPVVLAGGERRASGEGDAVIEFVTLLLGLVAGVQTVAVDPDPAVAAVELRLDGAGVGRRTEPPWRFVVDLGAELSPHHLEAVAFDAHDDEVGRAHQWLNLPREAAEARLALATDAQGWPVSAGVAWAGLWSDRPRDGEDRLRRPAPRGRRSQSLRAASLRPGYGARARRRADLRARPAGPRRGELRRRLRRADLDRPDRRPGGPPAAAAPSSRPRFPRRLGRRERVAPPRGVGGSAGLPTWSWFATKRRSGHWRR